MKKNNYLSYLVISISILLGCNNPYKKAKDVIKFAPNYSSLPKTINLNSIEEKDVRKYYSNLLSLDKKELQGTNLLKNLKPILRKEFAYISYDNVWKAYEITDRDWKKSPAKDTKYGTYNSFDNFIYDYEYSSSGNEKNNPYIHCYYRDQSLEEGPIKAFGDHSSTGLNREHIWPQSHGFKASNDAKGPAGTDLHHLVAADGYVNQTIHNNDPYGYVDKNNPNLKQGNKSYNKNNFVGKPLHKSNKDLQEKVFEPQDSDKGDIARACFYMVAMYNNYANEKGVISDFDPNLNLVSYVTFGGEAETSSDDEVVNYGNLKDLLEWNKIDPVDEYEIYRNDLIFNNYQFNRNPFIDFPSWADLIWGENVENKFANPDKDILHNGEKNNHTNISEDLSENEDNVFSNIKKEYLIIGAIIFILVLIIFIIILLSLSKAKRKKVIKRVYKNIKSNKTKNGLNKTKKSKK